MLQLCLQEKKKKADVKENKFAKTYSEIAGQLQQVQQIAKQDGCVVLGDLFIAKARDKVRLFLKGRVILKIFGEKKMHSYISQDLKVIAIALLGITDLVHDVCTLATPGIFVDRWSSRHDRRGDMLCRSLSSIVLGVQERVDFTGILWRWRWRRLVGHRWLGRDGLWLW